MEFTKTSQNTWDNTVKQDMLHLNCRGSVSPVLWIDGNGVIQNQMSAVPSKTAQNTWETVPGEDFLQLSTVGEPSPLAWISSDGTFGGSLAGQVPGYSNFVQMNASDLIPSETSMTISFNSDVTEGNILFVFAANNSPASVSDSQGNSYIVLNGNSSTSIYVPDNYAVLYYAIAKYSGPLTVTVSYGTAVSYRASIVAEYTNPLGLSNPIDVNLVNSVDPPGTACNETYSTLFNTETIVGFIGNWGVGSNYVASNPITYRLDANVDGAGSTFVLFDHIAPTIGSYTDSGVLQTNVYGSGVFLVGING